MKILAPFTTFTFYFLLTFFYFKREIPILKKILCSLSTDFQDIHIYDADDFRMDKFDLDLERHKVNISITFPRLRIKSNYNVNGKILVVTFDEHGPADGNYSKLYITVISLIVSEITVMLKRYEMN